MRLQSRVFYTPLHITMMSPHSGTWLPPALQGPANFVLVEPNPDIWHDEFYVLALGVDFYQASVTHSLFHSTEIACKEGRKSIFLKLWLILENTLPDCFVFFIQLIHTGYITNSNEFGSINYVLQSPLPKMGALAHVHALSIAVKMRGDALIWLLPRWLHPCGVFCRLLWK